MSKLGMVCDTFKFILKMSPGICLSYRLWQNDAYCMDYIGKNIIK